MVEPIEPEVCDICEKADCECDFCSDCGSQIGPDDYHACQAPHVLDEPEEN